MASELSANYLLEALRRDWAVRVLDLWSAQTGEVNMAPQYHEPTGRWYMPFDDRVYVDSPDDARLALALAVLPELPAAVRAKLEELPRSVPSPAGQGEWVSVEERLPEHRNPSPPKGPDAAAEQGETVTDQANKDPIEPLTHAKARELVKYRAYMAAITPTSEAALLRYIDQQEASGNALNYWSTRARELDQSGAVWKARAKKAESALAEARVELETTKPEWDATDGAHPCWWRGHDNGSKGMIAVNAKLEANLAEARAEVERLRSAMDAAVIAIGNALMNPPRMPTILTTRFRTALESVATILRMAQPSPDKGSGGQTERPDRCPRCDSPDPQLHYIAQHEGEVQDCPHPWHSPNADSGVGAHGASAQTKDSTPDSGAVSGVSVPGSDATDDGRCSRVAPSGGDSVPQTSSPVDDVSARTDKEGQKPSPPRDSTGAAGAGSELLTELPDRTGKSLPDPLGQPVTVRELVEALRAVPERTRNAAGETRMTGLLFALVADRLDAGRED